MISSKELIYFSALFGGHQAGGGQKAFRKHKRDGGSEAPVSCSSHFLSEEAAWQLEQNDGKLGCPKCSARLGSYCWSGAQCSCGTWVAPAIQVVKSKVDAMLLVPRATTQPAAGHAAMARARAVPGVR